MPATGGPTVTVTGVEVSLCDVVVQVTIARNCVVWLIVPDEIPIIVCEVPRLVQLTPSVDDCHWYSSEVATVLPVSDKFTLPSQAIVLLDVVVVPALGVLLHGGGGVKR